MVTASPPHLAPAWPGLGGPRIVASLIDCSNSRTDGAATLTGLSVRQRIAAIAKSQVGYRTDPSNSYCNKFSAYVSPA
jgi:hypothetical protein